MKYVAAYLLDTLGGKASPSGADVTPTALARFSSLSRASPWRRSLRPAARRLGPWHRPAALLPLLPPQVVVAAALPPPLLPLRSPRRRVTMTWVSPSSIKRTRSCAERKKLGRLQCLNVGKCSRGHVATPLKKSNTKR